MKFPTLFFILPLLSFILLTIQELLRNNPKSIHGECTNFPKNLILPSESVRPGNLENIMKFDFYYKGKMLSQAYLIALVFRIFANRPIGTASICI